MRWIKILLLGLVLAAAIPRAAGQGPLITEEWIKQDCGLVEGFNAVWGFSRDEVYVVGMHGTIVKFDGRSCRPQVNGTFESLYGVWGTSNTDLWPVGERGTIVHSDGGAWRPVQTNPVTESRLSAVWGTSHDDVFAVGEKGTILHFDGASWAIQESGTQAHLWRIWGTSPHDVFVAGDGTTLLYYDGARWKNILADYPDIGEVRALWGSTGNNVWIIANAPRGTGSDPDSGQSFMELGGVVFQVVPGRFPTLARIYDLDVFVSAVIAGSAGDAYLVVPPRHLLHLVGSMSSVVSASTPKGIRGIWRTRMDEFFAASQLGLFTYRSP